MSANQDPLERRSGPLRVVDDDVIEAIARRVVQMLRTESETPAARRLVSAAVIAERCDVSRQWVYENAHRLGAVRLGTGVRPRLRFDPVLVASLIGRDEEAMPDRKPSEADSDGVDKVDLIPLRGF